MIEILMPCIERWHCIDLVLKNIRLATKPKDTQILAVVSASDKYTDYLEKELKKIFNKVRVVRNEVRGIDHDQLRKGWKTDKNWHTNINKQKMLNIQRTYQLMVENLDRTADYYWFIEDDTLFPLNTYGYYIKQIKELKADVISGVSYYWHEFQLSPRNFWILKNEIKEGRNLPEIEPMPIQESGIVKLGATGLGNVLAKAKVVKGWKPQYDIELGTGADIAFFHHCMVKEYNAYGIWDWYLPHITKYENGDFQILGRLKKGMEKLWNTKS